MNARKTIAAISSALLLAFTLCAACGCQPSNEEVIRETVAKEFDAYKGADDAVVSELGSVADQEGLSELGISGDEFAKAVLKGFDYSIDGISVDGNSATVSMTVTSKSKSDFESKLNDAVTSFVNEPGTESLTAEEKNAKMGQIAMQAFEDTGTVSENVSLDFQLQGSTWVSTGASETLGRLDSLVFAS